MNINTDIQVNYLKNGTAVVLRPLLKSDRHKIQDGFDALSDLSRYRRFLHNKSELNEREFECLFATPAQSGTSLIALECNDTRVLEEGRCIGLIQMIELEAVNSSAEVALVVIDEFHNCGLGKLMLKTIEKQAVNRNIQNLYFYTTADNKPLSAMLMRTGWDISVDRDFGSLTYITKVEQERMSNPLYYSVKIAASAFDFQTRLINRNQWLTICWYRVSLQTIIFLNQFTMYFYKGRRSL